jgi:CelD/BcsL family acetyltransferase involved in cellulose biosynthesis
LETIQSIRQLESLRDEWDAVASGFGSPLLDHGWIASCVTAFTAEPDLRIVTVRRQGALVAAAPLGLEATAGGRRLTHLGASVLHEPGSWIFADEEALRELTDRVFRLGYPILLQRVPSGSPLCRLLPEATRGRAASVVRPTPSSLAVRTDANWDTYRSTLSSRITENLARLRRQAAKAYGAVEYSLVEIAPREVESFLDAFVEVEGSGWKGRRGSALKCRPALRRFFAAYCGRAAAAGRLRISLLRFGSNTVATELLVESHRRLWQLKTGFREEFARYYPGLQLTHESVKAAFARHLEYYEFLGAAEPWEEAWRPVERPYSLLGLYPFNARGVITACRDVGGAAWRRAMGTRHTRGIHA